MNEQENGSQEEEKPGRFVVIVRHGIAEPREGEKPDRDRELTAEGEKKLKQIRKALAKLFPRPDALLSSPYTRCVQTALHLSKAYDGAVTVRTSEALTPDGTPEGFVELLRSLPAERIIVVGHEPNCSAGMAALTGMKIGPLELKKGGCYGVAIDGDGNAMLEWMLTPKILRKL